MTLVLNVFLSLNSFASASQCCSIICAIDLIIKTHRCKSLRCHSSDIGFQTCLAYHQWLHWSPMTWKSSIYGVRASSDFEYFFCRREDTNKNDRLHFVRYRCTSIFKWGKESVTATWVTPWSSSPPGQIITAPPTPTHTHTHHTHTHTPTNQSGAWLNYRHVAHHYEYHRISLVISQHWVSNGLVPPGSKSHYPNQCWPSFL